jgi:tight adherence protein B
MDQTTLMIFGVALLAALCIGAIGFVFVGGESKADKRISRVAGADRKRTRQAESEMDTGDKRRKQVQETLKGLEQKQKAAQKITLRMRIERAGLDLTPRNFYMLSATSGLVCTALTMLSGYSMIAAVLVGFAGAFGLPRWVLSFLISRRQKAFLEEFANAIDVIVRGVKAGLPINDCLKIISNEAAEPVRSEFRGLVEGQRVGVSLEQGLARIYERMPLAEVNFFQIVLSIQQKTGGNLSEALGNLSKVLRDRKKMRAKIRAISQEAKSSAAIIGSLPPAVMMMLYFVAPGYLDPLITTKPGNMIIIGGLMWMGIGVLIMRKMINFNI